MMMFNIIYFHIQTVPGHMFMIKKERQLFVSWPIGCVFNFNTNRFYHRKQNISNAEVTLFAGIFSATTYSTLQTKNCEQATNDFRNDKYHRHTWYVDGNIFSYYCMNYYKRKIFHIRIVATDQLWISIISSSRMFEPQTDCRKEYFLFRFFYV